MVFGDGDGGSSSGFTGALDVIGHELATASPRHGRPRLPGPVRRAERVDVRRVRLAGQAADAQPDRRAGRLADRRRAVHRRRSGRRAALDEGAGHGLRRSAARQGPAAGDMADYVETADDNGGVHINSGIPNHAFYLAATALGGNAWERAGAIWYDVLAGGQLDRDADFQAFAGADDSDRRGSDMVTGRQRPRRSPRHGPRSASADRRGRRRERRRGRRTPGSGGALGWHRRHDAGGSGGPGPLGRQRGGRVAPPARLPRRARAAVRRARARPDGYGYRVVCEVRRRRRDRPGATAGGGRETATCLERTLRL